MITVTTGMSMADEIPEPLSVIKALVSARTDS
jgi:hypothetical protein